MKLLLKKKSSSSTKSAAGPSNLNVTGTEADDEDPGSSGEQILDLLPRSSATRAEQNVAASSWRRLGTLWRSWRMHRTEQQNQENLSNAAGAVGVAMRKRGVRKRKKQDGDDALRRLRIRRLRAMFRGGDAANQMLTQMALTSAEMKPRLSVWDGVFNSLSPTDTGGVLSCIVCLLALAVALLCFTEHCHRGVYVSTYEIYIWIFVQTVACIIISYLSFLVALACLSLYQWRKMEAQKKRKYHVKMQREMMNWIREGIRKYRDGCDSIELEDEPSPSYQQQQQEGSNTQQREQEDGKYKRGLDKSQSNVTVTDSNVSNVRLSLSAARRRRQDRLEIVAMLQELEGLVSSNLGYMGIQKSDLKLLEEALGPKRIGSAWISSNCRITLFKANGHMATAYAHMQRF